MMKMSVLVALAALMIPIGTAFTQTESAMSEPKSESTSIESLRWLAGHWIGQGFGGTCEEVWSPPSAGTMVGTFKLYGPGGISFYELMTIAPDTTGRLTLKVKHFNSDLTGWEERDKFAEFPLTTASFSVAQFGGLKYEKLAADGLRITVTISHKDGTTSEEVINCVKQSQ